MNLNDKYYGLTGDQIFADKKIEVTEDHKYLCPELNNAQADHSVTEIISGSNKYASKVMIIAAEVGKKLHTIFADKLKERENGIKPTERNLDIEVLAQQVLNIIYYPNPYSNIAKIESRIEKPMIATFRNPNINDKPILIGGTPDAVYITYEEGEDEEQAETVDITIRVFDLKTSTSDTINNDWRLQLAAYCKMIQAAIEQKEKNKERNVNIFCEGYIAVPGSSPEKIINNKNIDLLFNSFLYKLYEKYPMNIKDSDSSERIKELQKELNKIYVLKTKGTIYKKELDTIMKEYNKTDIALDKEINVILEELFILLKIPENIASLSASNMIIKKTMSTSTRANLKMIKILYSNKSVDYYDTSTEKITYHISMPLDNIELNFSLTGVKK